MPQAPSVGTGHWALAAVARAVESAVAGVQQALLCVPDGRAAHLPLRGQWRVCSGHVPLTQLPPSGTYRVAGERTAESYTEQLVSYSVY